jgi:peptidoglycan hydrolase-like protein with peptidoglycan-binding domain
MPEYSILTPPPRRHRALWAVLVVAIALVVVGGGAYLLGRQSHSTATKATSAASTSPTTAKASPLRVVTTTPAAGATDVPSNQVISVQLTEPVSASSGMPTLAPPVAGNWKPGANDTLTFEAAAPLVPTTTETLTIPSGSAGVVATHGALLGQPTVVSFTVAQASTERLQQMLAAVNYLPLSFTPSAPLASPADAFTAQTGTFAWKWAGLPAELTSLWTEGAENIITKGAVMNFEHQAGLDVDGVAGKQVWTALLADTASAKMNAVPYVWVFVSKDLPEALTLYSNGVADPQLTNVAVNTGAPGADTVDGTYPVFEHVPTSRMVGTNPDGSTYNDPAVPWASFFNGGDALHGFVRATYGSPQSNGCVEMPVATAAIVWPLTPIGTLVTVAGPPS